MKTSLITSACLLALATAAQAQTPAPGPPGGHPPFAPRAKGPPLTPAVQAAQAAVAACAAKGYKVTALIVDSAGDPVVLLSGDGAPAPTQAIAKTKIAAVMKYKMSSGDVAAKAKLDPALDAEIKANPDIGVIRQGAVPIMSHGEMIGAFAVSGAPGGEKDEACIKAALDKVPL
jgi:uncharacterized protein GlcG (DUF336 family)